MYNVRGMMYQVFDVLGKKHVNPDFQFSNCAIEQFY